MAPHQHLSTAEREGCDAAPVCIIPLRVAVGIGAGSCRLYAWRLEDHGRRLRCDDEPRFFCVLPDSSFWDQSLVACGLEVASFEIVT